MADNANEVNTRGMLNGKLGQFTDTPKKLSYECSDVRQDLQTIGFDSCSINKRSVCDLFQWQLSLVIFHATLMLFFVFIDLASSGLTTGAG